MLGDGAGSDVMQRIAGPMIGGMTSTLVLTLLVLPAIFYVWKSQALKRVDNA
jgi:Cu(I)/Ag(I) efflux system membrane protein CusA/SilA